MNDFWNWFFNPSLESKNIKKEVDSANGGKTTPATVEGKSYANQIGDFFTNKDNWILVAFGLVILVLIKD